MYVVVDCPSSTHLFYLSTRNACREMTTHRLIRWWGEPIAIAPLVRVTAPRLIGIIGNAKFLELGLNSQLGKNNARVVNLKLIAAGLCYGYCNFASNFISYYNSLYNLTLWFNGNFFCKYFSANPNLFMDEFYKNFLSIFVNQKWMLFSEPTNGSSWNKFDYIII